MNSQSSKFIILLIILITTFDNSYAKQTQPYTNTTTIGNLLNKAQQYLMSLHAETRPDFTASLSLSAPLVTAGVLCFVAASISSAGGVGGGGLFVPILSIIAGLDLKTASSFSAFMVTGASIANVACNLGSAMPRFGGRTLIDFDIALLSQPSMLLGVSAGVICNVVFPEWLITALFAVFLAWSTSKTFRNGVVCWKMESEGFRARRGCGDEELENGSGDHQVVKMNGVDEPLLGNYNDHDCVESSSSSSGFSWTKLGMLVLIWFSFSFLYLLRGNRYGEGITPIEPCGVAYWSLSSFQIPLAILYTAWILRRKESSSQRHNLSQKDVLEEMAQVGQSSKFKFPLMALLAGGLGGVFGIGGGMLISPLLLQVGIGPEITSATCSFMVFFSSTMSAFQYLMLGMKHTEVALVFAAICFVASLLGLVVVQKAVQDYGRASLIVFSVGIVMALSTVLMTSYGVIDVLRDYTSGNYMGFKLPC